MEALDILEKEKEISKETLFEAIENSLVTACKNHFGKADNVKVAINRETGDFLCYAEKLIVETEEEVEATETEEATEIDTTEIEETVEEVETTDVEVEDVNFSLSFDNIYALIEKELSTHTITRKD